MSIAAFKSDAEVVRFAQRFFKNRVETFKKDIAICMTPNAKGEHAYFPALIICISFADLLSGLHAGKLERQGLKDLQQYSGSFMLPEYTADPLRLNVLYEFLRHKIAHLAYPYAVFDTYTKPKIFGRQPRRRVAWRIHDGKPRPVIDVIDLPKRYLKRENTPWRVPYNCLVEVGVDDFAKDIVSSIYSKSGYLQHLRSSRVARERFAACMNEYFPR
jgi:hypothetical protein